MTCRLTPSAIAPEIAVQTRKKTIPPNRVAQPVGRGVTWMDRLLIKGQSLHPARQRPARIQIGKIRSTKSEIRNKFKTQRGKFKTRRLSPVLDFPLCALDLGFEFRISRSAGFGFPAQWASVLHPKPLRHLVLLVHPDQLVERLEGHQPVVDALRRLVALQLLVDLLERRRSREDSRERIQNQIKPH